MSVPMKKVIVLALCMLLLLSGCTYLGAAGARVEMRDLYITSSDQPLDMRDLSTVVEFGCNDDVCGLRLTFSNPDKLENELIAAVVEDSVLILLNGSTGEPYAFVIDDPKVVGPIQELFDAVKGSGETVDFESMTDEELDEYMAQLEEQLESMGLDEDLDPESADEAAAQAERLAELLEQCVTEGEPREFEGEMYDTMNIDLPHDKLMELLGSVELEGSNGEKVDLAALLEESGITVDVTGVIASNEDGSKNAFGVSPVLTDEAGDNLSMNFTLQQISEDGSIDVYFDISQDGQEFGTLSVSFIASLLEEADWLPDAVSADAQPVDFDDDDSSTVFADALMDFFGQVVGTLAGVTAGNGAIDALE